MKILKLTLGLIALICFANVQTAHAVAFLTGDVFASVASGNVKHYRADGTFLETLNIGASGYTTGMAFDAAGNLYVTGFSVNTVAKFDTNGTLLGNFISSGLSTPESIVFDNAGDAYVSSVGGSGIKKYSSTGTLLGTTPIGRVDWMDLQADQKTMLYTQEGSVVKAVDVSTNTPLANFSNDPGLVGNEAFALRILSDGSVLLADGEDVKHLDAAGNEIQSYDVSGENTWFALNLDPDGTSFWSGNFGSANLYKFDIASGANLQNINTGTGSSTLYGVGIFGEKTQGCTDCGGGTHPVPEPLSLALLGGGLGFLKLRRKVQA